METADEIDFLFCYSKHYHLLFLEISENFTRHSMQEQFRVHDYKLDIVN